MVHTEHGTDRADLVARVVEEYFQRLRSGEQPQLEEFVERYPEISELLRTVIPALQVAEQSSDASAGGTDTQQHKQLGEFRILRQLGRGGMGIVYEAEQISMNRRVALKVLPLAGLVDELKIRRFPIRHVASTIAACRRLGFRRQRHCSTRTMWASFIVISSRGTCCWTVQQNCT